MKNMITEKTGVGSMEKKWGIGMLLRKYDPRQIKEKRRKEVSDNGLSLRIEFFSSSFLDFFQK